jgi:hypothetical protein
MAETTAPVLDLTSTTVRPTVRIDKVDYELRTADDLSVLGYRRLMRDAPQVAAMLQNLDPTEDEERTLSTALDSLCRRALDAPSDVHDKLNETQRLRIFSVFTHLLLPTPPAARAGQAAAKPAGGTTSSRVSRGSTRARRSLRGSKKSPSGPSVGS